MNKIKINFTNNRQILFIVILIFGLIYCSISLVNHFLYRTYALDLGMINQAIYSFSHFKMNYFTLNLGDETRCIYFSDHFSPITILLSPFYYLFGSYTMLVIQIIGILFGGLGIYKYASISHSNSKIPIIITIQFFCIWGIYSALSFDYHNNVIAAMFVPWLIYFYELSNKKMILLFCFLIIITRENMALWLGFIITGLVLKRLMAEKWKIQIKDIMKFEFPIIIFSLVYFIIVEGKLMPYLSHGVQLNHLDRYSILGNSIHEIIINILTKPSFVFSLLFESQLKDSITFGIKSELHFMIFVSGGFALLYRPYFLIMLIPIYAQKLFSNSFEYWGINYQYSIEFVPIISLCLSDFFIRFKSLKISYLIAWIITLSTLFFTIKTIEERTSKWYDRTNTAFYSKTHYTTPLNIREINNILNTIPENAVISVSTSVAPHLAFRDKIYHFPTVKDATYIVLLSDGNTYPLSKQDFEKEWGKYIENRSFEIKYNNNNLLILKRN